MTQEKRPGSRRAAEASGRRNRAGTLTDSGAREVAVDPTTAAHLEELEARLDRAESWRPEPGERLAGKLVGWETIVPRDDEAKRAEVATLQTSAGLRSIWAYGVQLRTRLIHPETKDQAAAEAVPHEQRLAKVGDLVAVEYRGRYPHPTIHGATYKRYSVEIQRPQTVTNGDGDIPF